MAELSLSSVANIILTLLLIFQWYRKHASEQATKNNLLATRRMVARLVDPIARDILDNIDATLASLSARPPFSKWARSTLGEVHSQLDKEEEAPLINPTKDGLVAE